MDESQLKTIASQLSCPQGEAGIDTGNKMNLLNEFITARSLEKLCVNPGESIVEVGPGNGALSEGMLKTLGASGTYYGIELSKDMANEARRRLSKYDCNIDIKNCDCQQANVPEKSVDGIIAVNLLYFIEDLESLFKHFTTWIKPGGRVVFGVRSDKALNSLPFVQYKFNVRTPQQIMDIMQLSGFNHVNYSYYDEGEVLLGDLPITVDSVIIDGRV